MIPYMEFLLTRYIYPVPHRIQLSEHLGFSIDNPCTSDEITVVENYLIRAYESGYDYRFPVHSDEPIVTIEDSLFIFRDKFIHEDEYIAKVFDAYSRENIFRFLAAIWMIVRFDDDGLGQELRERHKEMREQGHRVIFELDDAHPTLAKGRKLAE